MSKVSVFHYEPDDQPDDPWFTFEREAGKDESLVTASSTWNGSFIGVEIYQGDFMVFKPWLSGYSDEAARQAIGAHPDAPVDSSGVREDAQGYTEA